MSENTFFENIKSYFKSVPGPQDRPRVKNVSAHSQTGPLLTPMNLGNKDIYEDYYLAQFLPDRNNHSQEQHHPAVPK